MIVELPDYLKKEYPFEGNFFHTDEGCIHYLDEGNQDGPVVLMLHGNPTWSYYYRNLVKSMSDRYRVIVPDHMGCGLSSKPQNYDYTLDNHIKNVQSLLKYLKIENFHLVVHDWGGAIGFGVATRSPSSVLSATVMNTAAFRSTDIPFRINICKTPIIGEPFVRALNAFAWPATFMASKKPLKKEIRKGYLFPYNNYKNRIATAKFVQDIPMTQDHPSYKTLKDVEDGLSSITCPVQILWGEQDFCFTPKFREKWSEFYPKAKVEKFQKAGHYILEDERDSIINHINQFVDNIAASPQKDLQ